MPKTDQKFKSVSIQNDKYEKLVELGGKISAQLGLSSALSVPKVIDMLYNEYVIKRPELFPPDHEQ